MAIVSKRTDPVRLFARRLALLALFIIVLIGCSALWDVYKKERESRILRQEAETQLNDLRMQQTHLDAEITRLKTERGKEELLRENYEMAKPGENMIVIIEPQRATSSSSTSTSAVGRWLHWITHIW